MTTGLTTHAGSTVFGALVDALKGAAAYNHDNVVSPVAILWPKGREKWESVEPRLRAVLLQFLTLGAYDKANRVGAAIWLRSVLAGRVPDVTTPPDIVVAVEEPYLEEGDE